MGPGCVGQNVRLDFRHEPGWGSEFFDRRAENDAKRQRPRVPRVEVLLQLGRPRAVRTPQRQVREEVFLPKKSGLFEPVFWRCDSSFSGCPSPCQDRPSAGGVSWALHEGPSPPLHESRGRCPAEAARGLGSGGGPSALPGVHRGSDSPNGLRDAR